jgi:WD repeat and SOF domain-containing protein 1
MNKKKKILKKKNEIFPKPFIDSLNGHKDSILKIISHPEHSSFVFTGSADGELRFWSLSLRKNFRIIKAHDRFVRGISIDSKGKSILSCSDDCTLKIWDLASQKNKPLFFFKAKFPFSSLASHPKNQFFLTGNKNLILWDQEQLKPIQKLGWNLSSISTIKFNTIEFNIITTACSDRSIILYDLRLHSPVKKLFLEMRTNDIIWSKTDYWDFYAANENGNVYVFDIRKLGKIKKIYQGHVMAVTSLDEDDLGSSIVTGSLDSTLRLFSKVPQKNPYIYFTQRMKRVLSISISKDGKFILSGSEDGNLRIWKNFYNKESNFFKNHINNDGYSKKKNSPPPPNLKNILKIKELLFKKKENIKLKSRKHILPGGILKKKNLNLNKIF